MSWEEWDDEERQVAQNAVTELRIQRRMEAAYKARKDMFDTVKVGDTISFWHVDGSTVTGVVTRKGTIAGWAVVAGTETRFENQGLVSVTKAGK